MNAHPRLLAREGPIRAPRQRRSRDRRLRLTEAALALFGSRGYEATTVEQVARRARLPVGTFYQHFRSKRQLLLVLMNDLLEKLSAIDFRPDPAGDVRHAVRGLVARAFAMDLRYLGAYRAWQEAVLSDPQLARKQAAIRAWTTRRLTAVFDRLQQLPGARAGVDTAALARVTDSLFWSLLTQALLVREAERREWIDSATHLVHHALFRDR